MSEKSTRDLQCPYCGYLLFNDTGIGSVHCGPHVNWRGEHTPAVRMRTIREHGAPLRPLSEIEGRPAPAQPK